jgi:hypothetical protein
MTAGSLIMPFFITLVSLPAGTLELWLQRFDPASVEASMDAIVTTANWEILRNCTPFRTMCEGPRASGMTLVCFAQHFSALYAGIERRVYRNIPRSSVNLPCIL